MKPPQASLLGTDVGARFRVLAEAGRGAMGAVYRARDAQSGDLAALKVLQTGDAAERFEREVDALARIEHDAVARYLARGHLPDGTPWLAMAWIEGPTLRERLGVAPLNVSDTIDCARRLAAALEAAHAAGVVHRDLKPANVVLRGGHPAEAVLVDFGLARPADASELTRSGVFVGTPGYVAPEQARGDVAVDGRADVFALGCLVHRMLLGASPFAGEGILAILTKTLLHDVPPLRESIAEIPAWLDSLAHAMLEKDPDARPSAAQVTHALATSHAQASGPSVPPERAASSSRSLTYSEKRVVSLVLAGAGVTGPDESTIVRGSIMPPTAVFERYGAIVDRVADGTIVGSVVAVGAASDIAARAARLALEARKSWPHGLVVATTRSGGRDTTAAAIDRATDLLTRRSPEEAAAIRIDETTAGLLDRRFDISLDERGFVLRGEREVSAGGRLLLGRETPFVGRDAELGSLRATFAAARDEESARGAVVLGDAGTGKSRLRLELSRVLASDADVWIARADSMSAGSPFAMLGGLLRGLAGIQEGEPLPSRRRKLRVRMARHAPEPVAEELAKWLGEAIGVAADAPADGALLAARRDSRLMAERIRAAFERLIECETTERPLVLLLEDAHWGDAASLGLVGAALKTPHPVVVVAFARPELEEAFPDLWKGTPRTTIALPPLPKRAGAVLVRALLPDADEDLVARLLELSGGNAFYLEELIRQVAEGSGDALPETVVAMAQSRLERLSARERRALRVASLFGMAFWAGAVCALAQDDGAEAVLDGLVARELVSLRPHSRFPGEIELVFRHQFVREAAYASLTADDRATGHRLAAEWLLERGESDARLVAEHFARSDETARAVPFFVEAATLALDGVDLPGAIRAIELAQQCGALGAHEGTALRVLGEAHLWLGDAARARDSLRRALEASEPGSTLWCSIAGDLSAACARLRHVDDLVSVSEMLHAQPGREVIVALAQAIVSLVHAGQVDVARRLSDRLEDDGSDPILAARVAYARATIASVDGDVSTHLEETRRTCEIYAACGDSRRAVTFRMNLGWAMVGVGLYATAIAVLEESLEQSRRFGIDYVVAVAKQNLGWAYAHVGRFDEAKALLREVIIEFERAGSRLMAGASRFYLAYAMHAAGEHAEAFALARAIVDELAAGGADHAGGRALAALAALAVGDVPYALEASRVALELTTSGKGFMGGIEEYEGLVWLARVEALRAGGDAAAARRVLVDAQRRLAERSAAISDVETREAFRGCAENARLLALRV